ncbi:hypothetical protein [Xenophilus sp.]|uniref:hypothetical protein n=1 Tax=Xenophilus sp. TaxID=1873499 RepID=UPI0037DCB7AD
MKKNPVMWAASDHSPQINHRKVTAYDRRWPRATFHDTWDEAHAAQVAKAEARVERSARELKQATSAALRALKALDKVKAMKKPEDA